MISFDIGDVRFGYRVAGACVVDDHVLLHRAVQDDFWSLPGGRCEAMESSQATLARELAEELAVDVQVGELLWVFEYFFHNYGKDHHELAFYYRYMLPPGCPILDR